MNELRDSINKLIEKTLTMEKNQELKQEEEEEIIDWTHPMYQSQPYLEENQEEVEIIEEKCTEKSQDLSPSPTKKSILNRHRIKYTATRIKYSPTRVKSRNFLSNISYTGISKGDFYNESFILDIFILLVKNLDPFSLRQNVSDKLKHEMIYMLWRECNPVEFYRYICEDDNFKYLNGRDVSQQGVLKIVGEFIDQSKEDLRLLQTKIFISTCLFSRVP